VRQRLASTEAALTNVEALTGSLETAELNASVIDALSAGNAQLAALNALMPASAVAEILEEGSAQREATEAIAAELARGGDAADEEGVAEELAALEAAVAAAGETPAGEGGGGGGAAPAPPVGKAPAATTEVSVEVGGDAEDAEGATDGEAPEERGRLAEPMAA